MSLYDDDILLWSEKQAVLLRKAAASGDCDAELDWPNVIEEIESVGRRDLHAVEESLLTVLRLEPKALVL